MTLAETALQNFARLNRLRLSQCSFYNPNVGEPAFKQVKVRKGHLVATVRAADSFLSCDVKLSDRKFGFAVNQPDRVCLMNHPVDGLRNVLACPVFVMSQDHEEAFIRWATSQEQWRLIEAFELAPRESLQIYINAACAVVEAERDIGMMIAGLADLAASVPVAPEALSVECTDNLPEDLRHLTKYMSRWAVPDDQERSERIIRASKASRTRLRAEVEPLLGRINEYLDSCSEPLPECALRLSYLAELVAELRAKA